MNETTMKTTLRAGRAADAAQCGRIIYEAFAAIAARHGFPPDFASRDAATGLATQLLSRTDVHAVVAEQDERVVGSNFLWEGDAIAMVGPITVDTRAQNAEAGRRLMEAVLERAAERGVPGVRLVQAAYHNRSLALYTKLGFVAREPLSVVQGSVSEVPHSGYGVRAAVEADIAACNALALRLAGHARATEVRNAVAQGQASVVERAGRVTGYTTGIGFFGHAIGESNDDLQALIAAAPGIAGPGFLLPTRNTLLLEWCLAHGLRIVQPMTLMTLGEYREPTGAYLPSILG